MPFQLGGVANGGGTAAEWLADPGQLGRALTGGRAGGVSGSDRTFAALTRSMWDRYVTEFMPYENKLIGYASDPTVISDAMSEASGLVQKSFDAQQGATQRRLRGLGLTLNADEQQAADRANALARSTADVNAQNVAGMQVRERQAAILGNPAPSAA